MAAVSGTYSAHATLSSTTVDTVTLSTDDLQGVEVVNRSGATTIYFRCDGTAAVAAANGTFAVLAGQSLYVPLGGGLGSASTVVSIIGDGNAYSVHGVGR